MNLDTLADVLAQVDEVWSDSDRSFRSKLYKDLLVNALKAKRDGLGTLDLKVLNRSVDEFRYAARTFRPYRGIRKVSMFGSARTKPDDPYYKLAVEFAAAMVKRGFMVITGAGDGIMRAGNEGAGAENSFGANVLLPFEQAANDTIADDPKLITFRFFFTRKLFFLMEAHAVALFPGGFGTHDEGFETLTLLQTGKNPPMPLVLMELEGEDYWESWDGFIRKQLLGRGLVSENDLDLYRIVHSADEAERWICDFYSTYHSMRYVRERLVIRLERELSDKRLRELSYEFEDFLAGPIQKSGPLPVEADEPKLADKPRLVLTARKANPGRLNQLILAINGMDSA